MRRHTGYLVALVVMLTAACGSAATGGGKPELTITSPTEGATVHLPLTVTYDSSEQLGAPDSGRDHVHLIVDGRTNDYTVVTTTSYQIRNLTPGRHTVEVTLQHADHSSAGASAHVTVVVSGAGTGGSGTPTASPTSSTY